MLTLLTMTGARPEAWELCKRWMRHQDFAGEVNWIVVDDGPDPQNMDGLPEGWRVTLVRPEPFWEQGQNTQVRNVLAGLAEVPRGSRLAIIEDDDYYAPGYLSAINQALHTHDLVGECNALYFNVKAGGGARCKNWLHASLCQTAMKGPAINSFREICLNNHKFLDVYLWKTFQGSKLLLETTTSIGIKGLPGRGGIGAGHRLRGGPIKERHLAEIMGEDLAAYAPYMGKK